MSKGGKKELSYLRKKFEKRKKKSEQDLRDTQNNNRGKDIRNDEIKPENVSEGSILCKLFWRLIFSEQKHIWECIRRKRNYLILLNQSFLFNFFSSILMNIATYVSKPLGIKLEKKKNPE